MRGGVNVAVAAIGVGARDVGQVGRYGRSKKVPGQAPADGLAADAVDVVVAHPVGATLTMQDDLRANPKVALLSRVLVVSGRRRQRGRLVALAVAATVAPDAVADPGYLRAKVRRTVGPRVEVGPVPVGFIRPRRRRVAPTPLEIPQ